MLPTFHVSRFLNPITYGDYPSSMREFVNDRLPTFSPLDSINLKGSLDFVGLNYYTAYYAANANSSSPDSRRYQTDSNCIITGMLIKCNDNIYTYIRERQRTKRKEYFRFNLVVRDEKHHCSHG